MNSIGSRLAAVALGLLLAALPLSAAVPKILLVARDLEEKPLSGLRFAYAGVESQRTTSAGATELNLPPQHQEGRQIKIQLLPGAKKADDWFLVNPQINIPSGSAPAELVLMRRSVFRKLADATRDATGASLNDKELSTKDRKRVLVEIAGRYGLSAEQLETALRSFAESQDPKDRGIASYLEGQYAKAEASLEVAATKKEEDLIETLRYLGAAQYEQAKYQAAAASFRKATALKADDASLLGWLGSILHELSEWGEAESLQRRALAIDEVRYGPDHPNVATDLNNLAMLLQATNRLTEAEPLMRRALAIDEASYGPEHPEVARDLNNLAQFLQDTNRLAEAEPLMRRALAIDETISCKSHSKIAIRLSNLATLLQATNRLAEAEPLMRRALANDETGYGPAHPEVATDLNNLAEILRDTNRIVEAEPLMRRALAIDETSLGPGHPKVATDLSNLAQLLQDTNRLAEAEPLMRRALAIDEASYGPVHPSVALRLNNLAQLLQKTSRLVEAEPLMRRALAIDESSYGRDHAEVARDLNNLAQLLRKTTRLAEAEPLMRRALAILFGFGRRALHEHPKLGAIRASYALLLEEMGKSPAEIEASIESLTNSPNPLNCPSVTVEPDTKAHPPLQHSARPHWR